MLQAVRFVHFLTMTKSRRRRRDFFGVFSTDSTARLGEVEDVGFAASTVVAESTLGVVDRTEALIDASDVVPKGRCQGKMAEQQSKGRMEKGRGVVSTP